MKAWELVNQLPVDMEEEIYLDGTFGPEKVRDIRLVETMIDGNRKKVWVIG